MLVEHIKAHGPIIQGVEGRIRFETGSSSACADADSSAGRVINPADLVSLMLLGMVLVSSRVIHGY